MDSFVSRMRRAISRTRRMDKYVIGVVPNDSLNTRLN